MISHNLDFKNFNSDNNQNQKNILFANESYPDGKTFENKKIQHSYFYNTGFKNIYIRCCDFNYSTFKYNYFKKTIFENISFVGCKFINCNFSDTTFISCDFRYASFKNCAIPFENFKHHFPKELNLKKPLCRNLALEHIKLGNTHEYHHFFFEERKTSRKYYIKVVFSPDAYMKKKYDFFKRIYFFFQLCFDFLNYLFWGYGENLMKLIFNIVFFNFIFYYIIKLNFLKDTSFIFLIENFFSCQSLENTNSYLIWLLLTHRILGIVFTGFFIACLFRKSNKR